MNHVTRAQHAPCLLTPSIIALLRPMRLLTLVQDYVNAFAVCLMRCNGDDKSPAYGRLLQLLAETRALKLTFCMLRPVSVSPVASLHIHLMLASCSSAAFTVAGAGAGSCGWHVPTIRSEPGLCNASYTCLHLAQQPPVSPPNVEVS